jgi:signal transduction histidine kinase
MPVVAFLEKQAKRIAMPHGPRQIMWIILLLAAGWFDYITGPEVASAPFYILILVSLALVEAWGACLGYSILAACVYLTVDLYTSPARASLVFPYWDATSRFLGFALSSIAISLLVAERRRLQQSERALQDRGKELEEKNRRIEETLRTVTRLQEELLTRERQNAIAEAISTAVYEMERPLASASLYVEEVVRLMTRAHGAESLDLVLDDIQPLAEKLAERVRDMERIIEDIRSLRKPDRGGLAGPQTSPPEFEAPHA